MDLLSEHSEPFSATWPSSGMTRSGAAFELPTPALPTAASASSSSRALPTPTAMDSEASGGSSPADVTLTDAIVRTDLGTRENPRHLLPTPQVADVTGGHKSRPGPRSNELLLPGVAQQLALLPTPAAHDSGNTPENHLRKKPGRSVVTSLQVLVDHDLIATGGRISPLSSDGSEPPDE